MTLPVEATGGGDAGGAADGGDPDGVTTTGVDGCRSAENPGLICMRRAIAGERVAGAWPWLTAAVGAAAAASLPDEAGAATAPMEDIDRGVVLIGAIGRSLPAAGMLFSVLSGPVGVGVAGRFPADDSLEPVLGTTVGSTARGAGVVGDTGFFINLWWSVSGEEVVPEGVIAVSGCTRGAAESG